MKKHTKNGRLLFGSLFHTFSISIFHKQIEVGRWLFWKIVRVHPHKATPQKKGFLTANQIQAVKLGVFTAAQRPRIPSSCTVGGTIRSLTSEGLDALRERVIEVSTQVPGCWYKVGLYLEDHSYL